MAALRRPKRRNRKGKWGIFLFVLGAGFLGALLCPFILPPEVSASFRKGTGVNAPRSVLESVPEAHANIRWSDGMAVVTGRGRIVGDDAQSRALARRAALTDARRNFLVLRERLVQGDSYAQRRRSVVSGIVRASEVHSERIEGSFYLLELDVSLNDLLKQGYIENAEF